MECPVCHENTEENAAFCTQCGERFRGAETSGECAPVVDDGLTPAGPGTHVGTGDVGHAGVVNVKSESTPLGGDQQAPSGPARRVGTGDIGHAGVINIKEEVVIQPRPDDPCQFPGCGSLISDRVAFICGKCNTFMCQKHRDPQTGICSVCSGLISEEPDMKRILQECESLRQEFARVKAQYVPGAGQPQAAAGEEGGVSVDRPATEYVNPAILRKLAMIRNRKPGFRARVWLPLPGERPGTRDIETVPADGKGVFRSGDSVQLCFQSERRCHLTLLDVGTSGKITIIFPNQFHEDSVLEAGKAYTIPGPSYGFDWIIRPPEGIETVKAIFTLDPAPLVRGRRKLGSPFSSVSEGLRTRDIEVVAAEMAEKARKIPPDRWAEGSCEFVVGGHVDSRAED